MVPAPIGIRRSTFATPSPLSGAVLGAAVGALLAVFLLAVANFGGAESDEGASILASVIAMPTTLVFDRLDWGDYASQWKAFIALAVPLNGLLLGTVAGTVAKSRVWHWRRYVAVLTTLWMGAFVITWWYATTH